MNPADPNAAVDPDSPFPVSSEPSKKNSYGQILKSSSIVGGAQGINYLISLVRIKLVAVLLGPSGVGLVGLYVSATELVGTIAGLGIDSSGVREVAEAHGSGDAGRVARTVKTLHRACWVTGGLAWLLTAALSYPLSLWTFGSGEQSWALALLGASLLFSAISGGQRCLLQGTRRIGDLAQLGIVGALVSTLFAVSLYAWLGERGIVPVLLTTAAVNLGFSWWFARRIQTVRITQSWLETARNSKRLINLGLAFMYGAVLASIVGLTIRAVIVRELGLDANGVYQAAWGISVMFAGFIISAMATDFYPRLTAVAHDNDQVNRLVNEQVEIGVLLALPGILCTLAFSPLLMRFFYSTMFLPGAELLPWFVIGVFGQVIIFPMGYIQRAKGAIRWIFIAQSCSNICHLAFVALLIPIVGVVGAAYAYLFAIALQAILVSIIAKRLSGFKWTQAGFRLLLVSSCLVLAGLGLQSFAQEIVSLVLGTILTGVGCVLSLRGIAHRLGSGHWAIKLACKVPLIRYLVGIKQGLKT